MQYSDNEITCRLFQGDEVALKYILDLYYRELVIHSIKIVINQGVAEEVVQDVIIEIWKNRGKIKFRNSIKAYLFAAVKNRSINYLKSMYARTHFEDVEMIDQVSTVHTAEDYITAGELKETISNAINLLPPKCKVIFNLSRNAGLTNEEIAAYLSISKKTVQAQISIAINKIKIQLKDHWGDLSL
jgi:RNA polymerase sigma-70 factor (ECF subfamily)